MLAFLVVKRSFFPAFTLEGNEHALNGGYEFSRDFPRDGCGAIPAFVLLVFAAPATNRVQSVKTLKKS